MTRFRVGAAALLIGALGFSAAVTALAVPAEASSGRGAVSMHVTSSRTITAPHTARPGRVHLRNTGAHSFYVYKLRHGNLSTFVRDTNSSSPSGLARDFFAVDHVFGHADVYATLSRGTYYLIDGDVFPIKKAWVSTLRVSGRTSNGTAPASAYPMTINSRDTLGVPASVSTRHPIRISSTGHHGQVVWLFHVGTQVTEQTVSDFIAHPSPAKYGSLRASSRIELASIDGPQTIWTSWRAPRGRYVVFTLAYDTAGHLHFAPGQARRLTVS